MNGAESKNKGPKIAKKEEEKRNNKGRMCDRIFLQNRSFFNYESPSKKRNDNARQTVL